MTESRRYKAVPVTLELVQSWITQGHMPFRYECVYGIPENARFVRADFDVHKYLLMIFACDDWDEVPADAPIPWLVPIINTYGDDVIDSTYKTVEAQNALEDSERR